MSSLSYISILTRSRNIYNLTMLKEADTFIQVLRTLENQVDDPLFYDLLLYNYLITIEDLKTIDL